MNILYVSDLSGMGGGEVSLLYLMDNISEKNKVELLCRVPGTLVNECNRKSIKTFCYDFKKNLIKSLINFKKIINEEEINVVHSNELTTAILHGILLCIIGKKNVLNVCTCHGQWYQLSKIKKILIKRYIKHIFCVSCAVENNLNKQGINNTSVSYLGVPAKKFNVDRKNVQELKEELGIKEKDIVVCTIARFQKIKGQLKGIKAIKELHKEYPDINYFLVGGNVFGSEKDLKYLEEVKKYIEQNQMQKYVHLLGERKDIPEILSAMDYLMITSDNESFGMVAIEAIAASTLIVSTPCDGIKEILDNNSDMISDTNDSEGLFKTLHNILEREDVKIRAKAKIIELQGEFSVETVSNKYLDIYQSR